MKKNKQRVFFDEEYNVVLEGVSKEECKFTIRVEGYIVEESDTQYKVKTKHSFWTGHVVTYIEYPRNSYAKSNMSMPRINDYYWLDKTDVTLLRDVEVA